MVRDPLLEKTIADMLRCEDTTPEFFDEIVNTYLSRRDKKLKDC